MSSGKEQEKAVSVTSAGILASRILGYVRDSVIMAVFGVGGVTDAFLIAYMIPNLFRRLAAEGALSASFIPIFARKEMSGREESETFAGTAISYVVVVLLLACVIAWFSAKWMILMFASGMSQKSPEYFDLAVRLMPALFPYLLWMSLYAIQSGMLNTRGSFGIPAAASALGNVAFIVAALYLVPLIDGPPERKIWGLVIGVQISGILQVAWVWWDLKKTGFTFRPSLRRSPEMTEMLLLMLPAALTLSVYQLNNAVNMSTASFLGSGVITRIYLAYRVIEFPAALFGTAVGTVTLPKAAQAVGALEFRSILSKSVGMCLLWMIPSVAAFVVFADPLIGLLFQYGKFTHDSAAGVADVLRVYAFALPFIGLARILSSACYAVKSPKIPMKASAVSILTNAVVSLLCVVILPTRFKPCGIAMGMTAASLANFILILRLSRTGDVLRGFTLAGVSRLAAHYTACALAFSIPLLFLSGRLAAESAILGKIYTSVAVFASMGLYFGFLKIFPAPILPAEH